MSSQCRGGGASLAYLHSAICTLSECAGKDLSLTFHTEILICLTLGSFQFGCSGYVNSTLLCLYIFVVCECSRGYVRNIIIIVV
jgi:hypothetical protein